MSEIWDADVNGAVPTDDDAGWDEDSDSAPTPARGRPKRKRRHAVPFRRAHASSDDADDAEQAQDEALDEDDEFAAIIRAADAKRAKQQSTQQHAAAQQAQTQRRSQRINQGSSSALELLDSDEPCEVEPASPAARQTAAGLAPLDAAAAITAAAAVALHCSAGVLSEQARVAAERDAALRRQLQAAAAAADLDDEEDEEDPVEEVRPAVQRVRYNAAAAAEVEDLTYDPDDIDSILQAAGAGCDAQQQQQQLMRATAAGGAGAASSGVETDDGVKLALTFRTPGCDDVTVRVKPGEPLAAALDTFRRYVQEQGWGNVQKFLSPDGDKLTGQETAADLGLEDDEIIEYYLQK